jgi:hypothetical protein
MEEIVCGVIDFWFLWFVITYLLGAICPATIAYDCKNKLGISWLNGMIGYFITGFIKTLR